MTPLPNRIEWPAGRLDFRDGAILMGVLNVTPDSFSDGGQYLDVDTAVARGVAMARQGAAILDIGAESTRPGAAPVSAAEQIRRAVPVIERLSRQVDVPVSIDTRDAEVAAAAIEAGAAIINDITALADDAMARLAVERQAPVILMHMQGRPETMQAAPAYDDVVAEVRAALLAAAGRAQARGVPAERIILDPGIGFGKTARHNLLLLNRLETLCDAGYRVLVGTSRKRFIGELTGKDAPAERVFGTAATVALAVAKGVSIVRVHDVAAMADVVRVTHAIARARQGGSLSDL